jgi:hypothetical protein
VVAAAEAVNETVTVQVGLHGLLVKVAVTPVGRSEVENVIACVTAPVAKVAVTDEDGLVEP